VDPIKNKLNILKTGKCSIDNLQVDMCKRKNYGKRAIETKQTGRKIAA